MMQIIDCVQGSAEWHAARAGIPTASEFSTVLAKGRDGKSPSLTRQTYMRKLAGEIITGELTESYSNSHMDRGKAMEDDARQNYAFQTGADPVTVGFIRNGKKGCSPDSMIDANGALEIKTKLPHLQIECLERSDIPPEHKAQCQGVLLVAEREWIDFVSYWPKLPLFIHRVYRDEAYLRELGVAIEMFNAELASLVEKVRRYGLAEAA